MKAGTPDTERARYFEAFAERCYRVAQVEGRWSSMVRAEMVRRAAAAWLGGSFRFYCATTDERGTSLPA